MSSERANEGRTSIRRARGLCGTELAYGGDEAVSCVYGAVECGTALVYGAVMERFSLSASDVMHHWPWYPAPLAHTHIRQPATRSLRDARYWRSVGGTGVA
eukprot:2208786-Rhodomonas_salina.1